MLNKSFNLSLVLELLISTLPSVSITIYNWYQTGRDLHDTLFLVSMGFSFWALFEGLFPLIFWVSKVGWTHGITVELFDDWVCADCKMVNSASVVECGGRPVKGKWWLPGSGGGRRDMLQS